MDASARLRASVSWSGERATEDVLRCAGLGGLAQRLSANMGVRMRITMSSMRDCGTVPAATAAASGAPKKLASGICWSRPFSAAATVECVAPQSDIIQPRKPSTALISFSALASSQAHVPLTRL